MSGKIDSRAYTVAVEKLCNDEDAAEFSIFCAASKCNSKIGNSNVCFPVCFDGEPVAYCCCRGCALEYLEEINQ